MHGHWYKEYTQGRRFVLKISPGENLRDHLLQFASEVNLSNASIVSAVGSVKDVRFRGIKTGAKLPITRPRTTAHEIEGPLELLGLEGNIFPDEEGLIDTHLHIIGAKSSGEVVGGHLFDCNVFATCEIIIAEIIVKGIERHHSQSGGVSTIFISEAEE
ncbi:PPC domain-containing DNA-binding protein [Limisalsivibrio acetivorans]|uniref:PPC domain-containing DNA-binding protein n=1 Tax=Limisalsivibrio acetivorans TaxID=1304888 RepID=UPI0003B760BD|nr:PPC domain-containing DNA-binding protein [Limisalsivibrio acetivorans]